MLYSLKTGLGKTGNNSEVSITKRQTKHFATRKIQHELSYRSVTIPFRLALLKVKCCQESQGVFPENLQFLVCLRMYNF